MTTGHSAHVNRDNEEFYLYEAFVIDLEKAVISAPSDKALAAYVKTGLAELNKRLEELDRIEYGNVELDADEFDPKYVKREGEA
jgi:hypothetical protein